MRKSICLMLVASAMYIGCINSEKSTGKADLHNHDSIGGRSNEPKTLKTEESKKLDAIKDVIRRQATSDTVSYTFLLEGNYSAEGNEGKAFYKNNKIQKIEITFYGETGKAIYVYNFNHKEVTVSQQRFNYKTDFTEVKSDGDITKSEEINFTTDLNGQTMKEIDSKADLDTFHELKKVVPFDLI